MRARFTCATTCIDTPPRQGDQGLDDPKWLAARAGGRRAPARAAGRPWIEHAPTRELLRMAQRFLTDDVKPGDWRQAKQERADMRQRCCATCCSPAPTPTSTDAPHATAPATTSTRTEAVRRDLLGGARSPAAPAAAGARRRPRRSTRRRRCRSRACSRPPRRRPRPRPNAPVLVVGLPARRRRPARHARAADAYGRYADLRPALKVGEPVALARHRPGPAPGAGRKRHGVEGRRSRWRSASGFGLHPPGRGVGGGVKGLFDRGKIGFLPGIDYANPDLSHFHSRHFWETGLVSPARRRAGWPLARPPRGARQPAAGPVDGRRPVAGAARRRAPVAAVQSPDDAQLWVPACGASGRTA